MALIQNKTASRQPITRVPLLLLLWLSCSTLGSLLFTTTYLIEGATRPGYDAWQQAISALSLGPGGWVQQVNFVVFGVIILWTTFAWRKLLKGGVGATWYPIMRGFEGLGLIIDGFFSQDPAGSVITGILTIVFITIFGIANGQHSAIAGLFERISTSLGTLWGILFFIRLWTGTGFGVFQGQTSPSTNPAS